MQLREGLLDLGATENHPPGGELTRRLLNRKDPRQKLEAMDHLKQKNDHVGH